MSKKKAKRMPVLPKQTSASMHAECPVPGCKNPGHRSQRNFCSEHTKSLTATEKKRLRDAQIRAKSGQAPLPSRKPAELPMLITYRDAMGVSAVPEYHPNERTALDRYSELHATGCSEIMLWQPVAARVRLTATLERA